MYASFRAIVPAGGAGTRLWPVSRRSNPKFLHDFTASGQSLLQATVDRLGDVADEVIIATGDLHAGVVQEQVPECGVITEPSPKDSLPAIALAAAVLRRRYPREDLVVGSFAADHQVQDPAAFQAAVRAAAELARRDELVTIGITPTHPATGFGYIRAGQALPNGGHRVEEFVEKPEAATAAGYVAAGYLWNAGMFVARASVLAGHLAQLHPDLAGAIEEVAAAWDSPRRREVLERVWPRLPAISIDHALAEPLAPLGRIAVVPADPGWSDVGDWDVVGQLQHRAAGRGPGAGGPAVLGDRSKVITVDSPGAVIAPGKQVVVLGIEGAVVVETADAILVTTREHAQRVKEIPDALEARGLAQLL